MVNGLEKYLDRVTVKLVREPMTEYEVSNVAAAKRILQTYMQDFDREHLAALFVNHKKQIQSIHEISVGTLNGSLVHPREVFKAAILANAAGIILAHNHPSGHLEPSEEDKMVTKKIQDAGVILGIELIDHLIISQNGCYSFLENQCILT